MKKILKKLLIFIVIISFIEISLECTIIKDNSKTTLTSASIQKDRLRAIKEKGVITVGSTLSGSSYFFSQPNTNKFMGIEGDIISEVMKRLGNYKIEAKYVPFSKLLEQLNTDDSIDIAAGGIFITPEREKVLSFTQPLYKTSEAILVPRYAGINYKGDLKNSVVGAVKGTVYEALAQKWKNDGLIKDVLTFESLLELYNAVNSNKVTAGIVDAAISKYSLTKITKLPLRLLVDYPPELINNVGIAMRKSDTTLLNSFNEEISKMKSDGTMYGIFSDNGLDKSYMPEQQ